MLQNIVMAHYFSTHALYAEGCLCTSLSLHLRNLQSIFLYIYSVRCVELLTFLSVYDGNGYQRKRCIFWIL